MFNHHFFNFVDVDEEYSITFESDRNLTGGRVVFDGSYADYRICTLSWTLVEAEMVCRHMGYQTAIAATKYPSYNDHDKNHKSIYFNCKKSHTSLHECIQGQPQCYPDCTWEAGVVCSDGKKRLLLLLKKVCIRE